MAARLAISELDESGILDQANDSVVITDTKGKILYVNNAVRRTLGKGKDFLGKNINELGENKEKGESQKGILKHTLETGKWRGKVVNYDHKGREVIFDTRTFKLRKGDKTYLVGISRDITVQEKLNQELRKSEESYQTIFDQANDAIFVHDISTGRILDVNRTMLRMYGIPRKKDIVGRSVSELSSGKSPYTGKEAQKLIERAMKDRPHVFEWHARKRNGELFWTEVNLKKVSLGGKHLVLAVVRDITEKRKAEKKLGESERKYRMIADNTDDMIAITKFSSKVPYTYVSPSFERVLGYKSEELVGHSALEHVHPDDMKKLMSLISKYISTKAKRIFSGKSEGVSEKFEYRFRDKSGRWRYLSSTANLIGDSILFVSKDITRQKETERKYKLIADHTSDLISILTFEMNPRYIYNSPSHKRVMGYEPEEICGKKGMEFVHPDDRGKLFSILRAYITEKARRKIGLSSKPWHETFSYRVKNKSGGWVHIETTADLVEDKILMVSRDVTQQKKAQDDIVRVKHEYEEIYRNLPLIAFTLDRKGKVIDANREAERFTGIRLKDSSGGAFSKLVSLDRKNGMKAWMEFRKNLRGEVTKRTVYRLKLRNGKERLIQLVGIPLYTGGKVTRVLVAGSDITQEKKAQEEMKRSFSLIRATMESTDDGILVVDRKGRVSFYNDRFRNMWNIHRKLLREGDNDKLLRYMCSKLADTEGFLSKVRHLNSHPKKESFDKIMLKDGRVFERYSQPQRLGDRVTGRVWNFRDVTGARRAQERIVSERNISESVINSLPGVFYMFNRSGRFLRWNKNFEKVTGLSGKELEKTHPTELFRGEEKKLVGEKIASVFRKGSDSVQASLVSKQGKATAFILTGHRISMGKKAYLIGTGIDITDRKRAGEKLKESENMLRSILQSMVDTVFVFDRQKRFTYIHAPDGSSINKKSGELTGRRPEEVMPADVSQAFERALENSRQGHPSEFQYSLETHGSKSWYNAKMSPIQIGKRFTGAVAVVEDITGKKKTEEEIKSRQSELERFNRLAVGRELRMIQLKKRIRELEGVAAGAKTAASGGKENEGPGREARE